MSEEVRDRLPEGPMTEERILVALDASPQSQVALRAAARVAAAIQAELQGLFVEDANLFHLCNSPFCREVGLRTAVVRQLESHTVERQLRVLAAEMRRSLARVASEAQVRWSFQVARGAVEHELLAAAEHALLLTLGRAGWLAGTRLGSTTRTIVQRTMRPLLILGSRDGFTHPLTVLYNGSASADRALALAVRLAQRNSQAVAVLLVGPTTEVEAWQARIGAFLQAQQVQPTFTVTNRADELGSLLQRMKNNSLVLPLDYAEWLAAVEGPVLLVP
jgi:nucleotide-binding universal stress UspA family protein